MGPSKDAYRRKYLALQSKLTRLLEGYDCGLALAMFLNPEIEEAQEELSALVKEIESSKEFRDWKKS